jgi:hypothetical protein
MFTITDSPIDASEHCLTGILRPKKLLVLCLASLCIISSLEAQAKARRPSRYACPVTANLFPKQERSGNVLRYIFPDYTKLARRMSIALVSSDRNDVEIASTWTNWRPHPGSFIVRADGSPNCYFLGPVGEYSENMIFVEITLTIPPGVEVRGVSFSSLGGEYVSRNCPMPELGKEIMRAYEDSRLSPQDEAKTAHFIALMEKALPEYDCVQRTGWGPVPAWCLIDENLDTIIDLIHYLYQKVEDSNESALKVFAGMFDKADGIVNEEMAGQIWEVLHDKPLFVLKVWPNIRNYKTSIFDSCYLHIDSIPEMIEVYRDVARKEPKYKSACDEIIGILSEKRLPCPQS